LRAYETLDHASLREGARLALYADTPLSKSRVYAPRLRYSALSLRDRKPPSPRAMPFSAPARRARLHLDIAAEQITHLMSPAQKPQHHSRKLSGITRLLAA